MKKKTISAKFETVDMAEFAAKGLKNNFQNIYNIKIRFKNLPEFDYSENIRNPNTTEHTKVPFWNAAPIGMNATGSNIMPAFFYFKRFNDDKDDDKLSIPEIERTTESRIIVEAEEAESKKIASRLRCLGGYKIEVY